MYLGDFTTANTVYVYFNTFDSNDPSASVTLTGLALGDIFIYKNGSTTERSSTAGITLLDTDGIDFDAKTGIHGFSISLADNTDAGFYAAGNEYTVVIASVTVDAATVNFVACHFSIERTGGVLALLKGTNSLADIESKIDTLQTNVGTAGAGLTNIGTIATVTNLTNLPSIPANWITAAGIATDAIDGDAIAASAVTEIQSGLSTLTAAAAADAVWDEALSGHLGAGSTGEALNAAGAAGDPWTTTLPGAYTGSQAGKMLSDIITDTAEIGAAGAGLTALATAANLAIVDTVVDSILVDTAEIGAAGAGLTAVINAVPTATQNADALLNRDMSAVSDTNARSPLNALRFLRNKYSITGTTLTVTKEDDTVSAWTSVLTTNASAEPVTGSDPA